MTARGKVVVNRAMSLDGFIAGPGDAMDWGDGRALAGQCLQRGLVDEILVYVLPVLLGDGIRFSIPRPREDGSGTDQQHAVARRHHPPLPHPQAVRRGCRLAALS